MTFGKKADGGGILDLTVEEVARLKAGDPVLKYSGDQLGEFTIAVQMSRPGRARCAHCNHYFDHGVQPKVTGLAGTLDDPRPRAAAINNLCLDCGIEITHRGMVTSQTGTSGPTPDEAMEQLFAEAKLAGVYDQLIGLQIDYCSDEEHMCKTAEALNTLKKEAADASGIRPTQLHQTGQVSDPDFDFVGTMLHIRQYLGDAKYQVFLDKLHRSMSKSRRT
jgi:hypothetical protein